MTTYDWPTLRERAIQAFNGDTPGANVETAILTHFQEHPGRVTQLIDAIARKVAEGSIRSGWAILAHELAQKPAQITATDNAERAKQIRLVEKWLTTTGGHIDTEAELVDAVFGPHGRLYLWNEDEQLIAHITELWHEQRPRFAKAELESEQRQAEQSELLKRLRKNTCPAGIGKTAADEHAMRVHAEIERARLAYLASIAPDQDDDEPDDDQLATPGPDHTGDLWR